MLSKVGVLAKRSLKKSKKHHAIAPAALGGSGSLGQLWEALVELWEALGELLEGLYNIDVNIDVNQYCIDPPRAPRASQSSARASQS